MEAAIHLIMNNSHFLILPWVQVKYLASSVLSMSTKKTPDRFKSGVCHKSDPGNTLGFF
jgi:hypothetical protein